MGSISEVADSSGALVSKSFYHTWGTTRSTQGSCRVTSRRPKRVFSAFVTQIRFAQIEQMCYNIPNCIDMQKCTLTTWFCSQTRRYAPSKNAAILANLANPERSLVKIEPMCLSIRNRSSLSHLNKQFFPVIVPFCAIKKLRKSRTKWKNSWESEYHCHDRFTNPPPNHRKRPSKAFSAPCCYA